MKKQILFVDDELKVLDGLRRTLRHMRGQWEMRFARSGEEAMEMLTQPPLPDLILCDIMMPGLDGFDILEKLRQNPATALIPFIFLTGKADKADMRQGMELGADDYLTKPFTNEELINAINARLKRKAIIIEQYQDKMREVSEATKQENKFLQSELQNSNKNGGGNLYEFVHTISNIIDSCEKYYYTNHAKTVAIIARALANSMKIDAEAISNLVVAALLHDVGKIGMTDELIALDPKDMRPAELSIYKNHVDNGLRLLDSLSGLDRIRLIIAQHHENFDGSGFPSRLVGEKICTEAQILSIANIYHNKVYKMQYPISKSSALLHGEAMLYLRIKASWYQPDVLEAFVELAISGKCPALG